ncbi:glgB1 [Symbiodinium natans]|uniref:GlgB1 protein n=1 Tax=Symbiodinium natans TaxID=878477 RepID=A0A812GU90_9DINO|nr:glgB1 [Symbiodinium natans]
MRESIEDYPPEVRFIIAASLTAGMLRHGLFEDREPEVLEVVIEGMVQNPPNPQKLNFALTTVNQLMDQCVTQDIIRKYISNDNVVQILMTAKAHRADGLKDICMDFITNEENMKLAPAFKELIQESRSPR